MIPRFSLVYFGGPPEDESWQVWDNQSNKPIASGPTLETVLQAAYPKCGAIVIQLKTLEEDARDC